MADEAEPMPMQGKSRHSQRLLPSPSLSMLSERYRDTMSLVKRAVGW